MLLVASAGGCSSQENVNRAAVVAADDQDNVPTPGPTPIAVVDEMEADLGTLDPSEELVKLFTIRNEGEAPLELQRGGTSCTCTMSVLPDEPIRPGEAATVRVSTKSEDKEGSFSHTATVLTNDPENPRLVFRVRGEFRTLIAFDPPKTILSSLDRDKSTAIEAVVYSQVFRDFELESISSTLDGLVWDVSPAIEPVLKGLKARCGYQLRLTLPPGLQPGHFLESLTVRARSADDPPKVSEATHTILGSVLPCVTMTGKKFGVGQTFNLGPLRCWEGAKERFTLTVRDDHRSLEIKSIEVTPDFLQVEVVPMLPDKPASGLYWVTVVIPKDAPPSNYVGSRKGGSSGASVGSILTAEYRCLFSCCRRA